MIFTGEIDVLMVAKKIVCHMICQNVYVFMIGMASYVDLGVGKEYWLKNGEHICQKYHRVPN